MQEVLVPKVIAAIPAYNEEETIGSVVLKALKHVDEVLVVDDGSTDRTAEVAHLAGATVFEHKSNMGYGAALGTCLRLARESGVTALVTLDADGQHDPNQIPEIVQPVLNGEADISLGSRFIEGSHLREIPNYRRYGIRSLTRLANFVSSKGSRLNDSTSGFRAYSANAIEDISISESGMGATTEILLQAKKKNLEIHEVPISCRYDMNRERKSTAKTALSIFRSLIRHLETEHALLTFGIPGLVLFLSGLIFGFQVIDIYYSTERLAVGSAILTVLLMTLGMLLGFTGLILHAVITAQRRSFE